MVLKETNKPFVQQDDFLNRATTHDILQIDQFYCKNPDLKKEPKATDWCTGTDRLKKHRKFFFHRLCDGMKDCLDGKDENDFFCKEAQP